MAGEQPEWRALAFEVYRDAWSELSRWQGRQRQDLQYWLDELKEALLDLKEATISNDSARALWHLDEVQLLLAELRLRSREDQQ
ncbi:MAG TPA: hypothetical protein VF669_20550 [Tepidisphaeraceae bacterium]|jgi:hypothetical protein